MLRVHMCGGGGVGGKVLNFWKWHLWHISGCNDIDRFWRKWCNIAVREVSISIA